MRHKNDDDINDTLIWVHEDMLRADHPAFHAAETRARFLSGMMPISTKWITG